MCDFLGISQVFGTGGAFFRFNVQCSTFDVRCSMFDVRCSSHFSHSCSGLVVPTPKASFIPAQGNALGS
jgi:hypothetical protein